MSESRAYQWLTTGDAFYAALLAEIGQARDSIRLEMYIYRAGQPGDAIRDALLAAAKRGVQVRILLDHFGSLELPGRYFSAVTAAGGQVRFFNPFALGRSAFRDHRKLFIRDNQVAFIGGFNISGDEIGDGVTGGWRDLGLRLDGPFVGDFSAAFERMFTTADFRHPRLARFSLLRRGNDHRPASPSGPFLLASGPGRGGTAFKKLLMRDLKHARTIRLISAYFLPSYRIRRHLARAARKGRDVRIITAGRTDVRLARLAGRALYKPLLRAGIRLFEYEPQILHTKLIVAGDVVYVGSANLDTRSLNINYELLARIEDRKLADEARQIFNSHLRHCREIDRRTWSRSRGILEKAMERLSHFLLARVDLLFARRQLDKLR